MQFTLKKKSDLSTILVLEANAESGQWDEDEAPIRYTVHRVIDGAQVELRANPPVPVKADRQIVLTAPVVSITDRTTLLAVYAGVTYGVPILLSNAYIAGNGIEVVLIELQTAPNPGATTFQVRAVFQPTT